MKTTHLRIQLAVLAIAAALFAQLAATHAAELRTPSDTQKPFSFVVIGDMHYTPPAYKTTETAKAIAATLKDANPPVAFICQTGDVVEGGEYAMKDGRRKFVLADADEMRREWAFAMKNLTETFPLPIFIAEGNHDKHGGDKAFGEIALPVIAKQLGAPAADSFYAFRYGNSAFIMLDSSQGKSEAQKAFIKESLAAARTAPGVKHIFVFAHHPVWPMIRPGFINKGFSDVLLPELQENPVDVYFCGHTHNTSVCVRNFNGKIVRQIEGVACGNLPGPVPLGERRTLLVMAKEAPYCWGYNTGPKDGSFLVTVDGDKVNLKLHSGTELIRECEFTGASMPVDIKKPAAETTRREVTQEMLNKAKSARLIICPSAEDPVEVDVVLNGQTVAHAKLGPTYRGNAFWDEAAIEIPTDKLGLIKTKNEILLTNPAKAVYAVGSVRFEVTLADDSLVRSAVSDSFYFSSSEADAKAAGKTEGWRMAPAEKCAPVALGQPVGPIQVGF